MFVHIHFELLKIALKWFGKAFWKGISLRLGYSLIIMYNGHKTGGRCFYSWKTSSLGKIRCIFAFYGFIKLLHQTKGFFCHTPKKVHVLDSFIIFYDVLYKQKKMLYFLYFLLWKGHYFRDFLYTFTLSTKDLDQTCWTIFSKPCFEIISLSVVLSKFILLFFYQMQWKNAWNLLTSKEITLKRKWLLCFLSRFSPGWF